jgi:ERCC4-related helicase
VNWLALPASTTTTVFVDMSARERALFGHANQSKGVVESYKKHGAKVFAIERCFLFELKTALRENPTLQLTKVKALVEDLREMRKTQPNLRAVVFTQYKDVHHAVVELVKGEMVVYKFDG